MFKSIVKPYLFVWIICLLSARAVSQNFSDGFNFSLPADDSSAQVFLPGFPKEEITSFIGIDANGHFSSAGQPIRFWGVNVTTGSCFPLKDKSLYIAARMRKMGINLVRFHHMDNGWSNNDGTIFLRGTGNTRQLDPIALDRLLYLLAQMKKNAVYANINLHVSRTFLEGDGVLNADSIWQFGKGITYFDPHLIELQKEFASQLLSAENPYTGLTLANDPVIAMVEISNENTLYGMWKGDQLKKFGEGGNLMQRHDQMLDQLWWDFLEEKYVDQSELIQAWGDSQNGGMLENQLKDGDFELGNLNTHWHLELHQTAQATMEASTQNPHSGMYAAKVDVTRVTGTTWHIQFKQNGLTMQKDSSYVVEFFARADRENRKINVGFQRDEDPWTYYGGTTLGLGKNWQRYRVSLTAPEDNNNHLRIGINFADELGAVWFDDMVFSKPHPTGLDTGEDLANRNIDRTDYSQRHFYHAQRMADLAEFYLQIQRSYYQNMYAFLKDELGVKVPITGTNALVGPSDLYTQQDLDYIDDHAYWNHPSFPSEPWSPTDWFINNESMLQKADLGTIGNIFSGLAMEGKPYTVSEYNHPFPNRYQWEMIPVLASYASFHDADGLMFFQYNGGSNDDWDQDFIDGFFPIHRNSSLMSMSPIFAYVYRNHLIASAPESVPVIYSEDFIYNLPGQDNNGRWGKYLPYDKTAAASYVIRTLNFDADSTILPASTSSTNMSSTGELNWNDRQGIHTINTPRLQTITGAINKGPKDLDFLKLMQASAEGVVSWMSLDGSNLPESDLSILSLHSQVQNSNMVWDGDRTVHDQWGSSPTLIRPLQLSISLLIDADSIHVFPLDEVGRESSFFTVYADDSGQFELDIDQKQYNTPWYGIRAYRGATSANQFVHATLSAVLKPNPTREEVLIEFEISHAQELAIQLFDISGREIRNWHEGQKPPGHHQIVKYVGDISPGIYLIKLSAGGQIWTGKVAIK